MVNIIGLVGRHAPRVALKQAHRAGLLDMKLGLALMRDQRVSILAKLAAVATGVTLTAVMVALEVPLEAVIGALLPFLGFFLDIAIDGLEIILLPLVVASVVIRWFAPKHVVESILQARAGHRSATAQA